VLGGDPDLSMGRGTFERDISPAPLALWTHPVLAPTVLYDRQCRAAGLPAPMADECIHFWKG